MRDWHDQHNIANYPLHIISRVPYSYSHEKHLLGSYFPQHIDKFQLSSSTVLQITDVLRHNSARQHRNDHLRKVLRVKFGNLVGKSRLQLALFNKSQLSLFTSDFFNCLLDIKRAIPTCE